MHQRYNRILSTNLIFFYLAACALPNNEPFVLRDLTGVIPDSLFLSNKVGTTPVS